MEQQIIVSLGTINHPNFGGKLIITSFGGRRVTLEHEEHQRSGECGVGLETFALALANEGGQINVPCGGVVGWYRSLALVNGFWSCSIYILFTLFINTHLTGLKSPEHSNRQLRNTWSHKRSRI